MSKNLSNDLLKQMFASQSEDPFLLLLTLSHESFDTIYLVNNSEDIVSRGNTYLSFPMEIQFPVEDGETARQIQVQLDNVSLELITQIRTVSTPIQAKVEAVLASKPNIVEIAAGELELKQVSYNAIRIIGTLTYDDFLNVGLTSEKYEPQNFRGLFS